MPHTPLVSPVRKASRHAFAVSVSLVFAGGACGAMLRDIVTLIVPAYRFPVAIFAINIVGAFILGWLGEHLLGKVPDPVRRERLRLTFGTGVMGGFTTYSSFAADSAHLVAQGYLDIAVLYALASVVTGLAACALGVWAGARTGRITPALTPVNDADEPTSELLEEAADRDEFAAPAARSNGEES
ncbi:fluoride efflux transporter FluC [Rarobacter incanus]|uniref:Fluoride-specific ion channel FluC n=1 Tax=Rarobacter incanus TaxID=153494 RepID=A0A542SNF2_9MICO|nr:CrcB family protein [Rarobacter incanus]TQK76143.1 protein CrcB [Rarobacter incanus]